MRPIGNVCYDLQKRSYAWSRDQQRLEKIDGKIHRIVGNITTSGSLKRSIVRSIVAPDDRSYDQSWNSATDRVGRRMGSDMNPRNISTLYSASEQSNGGTTGRKVARPVARLIVRPLTIWNRRLQVLNMTIDLVATDLPLAITHDLCDQSYVFSTMCLRCVYDCKLFWSQLRRNLVVSPV